MSPLDPNLAPKLDTLHTDLASQLTSLGNLLTAIQAQALKTDTQPVSVAATLNTTRAAQAVSSTSLTFGAGASVSSSALFSGQMLLGFVLGATWTAADVTLQRSLDNTTFYDVYDDFNNLYTVKMAASRWVQLTAPILGTSYLRLRSGTTATPVVQVSATSIAVVSQNA